MSYREATIELSSSIWEVTGYDEIYSLGREPEEDFLQSLERESSTHSLNDEEEDEEEEDEGDKYGKGDEDEEDKEEPI